MEKDTEITAVEAENDAAGPPEQTGGVLVSQPAEVAAPDEIPQTASDTTGEAYTESSPSSADAAFTPDDTQSASVLDLFPAAELHASASDTELARKLAVLEAVVYVTDEPLSLHQIATALNEPLPEVRKLLDRLVEEYNRPEHGLTVKEVAGGYKMATKPEHHDSVRSFVKNLNPPLKLSLPALETLAVIAYKQPITAPEIMEIRGVQGAGVLKTLLERKLIATAGRKQVVGKPILYKTTKEFLVQFGLKDLNELPSLKEFEDLRRLAFSETEEEVSPAEDVEAEAMEQDNEQAAAEEAAEAAAETERPIESSDSKT